jgi:hypothetical protein
LGVCNGHIDSRIKGEMMIRRIFASSIVALLLLITPLAVACDLSCAFSFMKADCHAAQTDSLASASARMNMDGMDMAAMDMPEVPGELSPSSDSAVSLGHAAHPSIGDMGQCEKQTCDSSAVTAESWRSDDSHFRVLLIATGTHRAEAAPVLFRSARDETTNGLRDDGNFLRINLRI